MTSALLVVAANTPSMALRYAAAFFLVVVGIGAIYALVRLGGAMGKAEKLLADVDTEVVPLLKQATETLDGVNTELDKIDVVMTSVVDATGKVDQTTRAVESAISVPAKKAAAFGAGVSHAVSTFFNRSADGAAPGEQEAANDDWSSPMTGAPAGASWAAGPDAGQASWPQAGAGSDVSPDSPSATPTESPLEAASEGTAAAADASTPTTERDS